MFQQSPVLYDANLFLRPLRNDDFDGLYRCAGDKRVWEGHPSSNRYEKNAFMKWFQQADNCGHALTIYNTKSNNIIGSSRFYFDPTLPNSVCIGFTFLAFHYWGGNTNWQLKTLMLDHAFKTFDSVWFHISPENIRSQRATKKIGAHLVKEKAVSICGGPVTLTQFYKLDKKKWQK